jgi:hypothetical protein
VVDALIAVVVNPKVVVDALVAAVVNSKVVIDPLVAVLAPVPKAVVEA